MPVIGTVVRRDADGVGVVRAPVALAGPQESNRARRPRPDHHGVRIKAGEIGAAGDEHAPGPNLARGGHHGGKENRGL